MKYLIIVLLLVIILLEFVLILKDDGIIAGLIANVVNTIRKDNTKVAFQYSVSKIRGMIGDIIPHLLYRHDDKSVMTLAFAPTGGMGDYIISKKIFEELIEVYAFKVVVYCENTSFGKAIYGCENVEIKQYRYFDSERNRFDLAVLVEHLIHIKNYDKIRILQYAPLIMKKIEKIESYWGSMDIPISRQWARERIHFDRCELLGLNRWTELRMGEAFEISEKKVSIPLLDDYREKWNNIRPEGNYITINYGADAMIKNSQQIKVWPLEHYHMLVESIKSHKLDVKIIQLGVASAPKIDNCDMYLLGEELEMVKWVLKDSSIHIDCEGGLVHLATQLNTKCIVMFGPTPEEMYAYEQNINLRVPDCSACMGFHEGWAYTCFKGLDEPICMYGIKPGIVEDKIINVLREKKV